MYKNCKLCPRVCGVDRYRTKGYCNSSNKIKVALSSIHMYEEPCISGASGSGTIFFSSCNLSCVYCQNKKISHNNYGKYISIKRLSEIMLDLQKKGVHNINLVTPTHFVPSIVRSIKLAKNNGLNIPIIYNTSGYEKADTIKLLNGYIDIYLTDFKYYSNELSTKYSNANKYFLHASNSLAEMKKQIPNNIYDDNGLMLKGIIVRHLVLPNNTNDSKKILKYLYNTYNNSIVYSIMNQYTLLNNTKFNELNRNVTDYEYDSVIDYAYNLGITNAYTQEGGAISESFIPNFDLSGV